MRLAMQIARCNGKIDGRAGTVSLNFGGVLVPALGDLHLYRYAALFGDALQKIPKLELVVGI